MLGAERLGCDPHRALSRFVNRTPSYPLAAKRGGWRRTVERLQCHLQAEGMVVLGTHSEMSCLHYSGVVDLVPTIEEAISERSVRHVIAIGNSRAHTIVLKSSHAGSTKC